MKDYHLEEDTVDTNTTRAAEVKYSKKAHFSATDFNLIQDILSPVKTRHNCWSPLLSIGIHFWPRKKHCMPWVSKSQRTMVQPILSTAKVNSAVNPVTDTHLSSMGSSCSLMCIIFHALPGSLVLVWSFCGKLYWLCIMSCGMKGQLGAFILWLRDSGNSKCKISWNHGTQWENSSLELFIVLFNDDSWAFQDLEDRVELKPVTSERN